LSDSASTGAVCFFGSAFFFATLVFEDVVGSASSGAASGFVAFADFDFVDATDFSDADSRGFAVSVKAIG
jgi:hypothetical protein